MGRIMRFTEFNTVLLNETEMDQKTFWQKLENNIDDEYSVDYDEEEHRFAISFDNRLYDVILTDKEQKDLEKGLYSPLVKKLMILSRIQKVVDITSGNSNLLTMDVLDNETKRYYLTKLRQDNKRIIQGDFRYFKNLWEDMKDSKEDMVIYAKEFFKSPKVILFGFFGVIFFITVGVINNISLEEVTAFFKYSALFIAGVISPILIYPISFLVYNTKKRFERLRGIIKTKKLNKVKIKSLEKSIMEENKVKTNQEISLDTTKEYKKITKLSEIIDHLLDSINEISPLYRGELTKKVKEIIEEYKTIALDNKKDYEIAIKHPEFLDKLNELEMEINNVKILLKEQNRTKEIAYLEDKLKEIEEKGYSYKKTR